MTARGIDLDSRITTLPLAPQSASPSINVLSERPVVVENSVGEAVVAADPVVAVLETTVVNDEIAHTM